MCEMCLLKEIIHDILPSSNQLKVINILDQYASNIETHLDQANNAFLKQSSQLFIRFLPHFFSLDLLYI